MSKTATSPNTTSAPGAGPHATFAGRGELARNSSSASTSAFGDASAAASSGVFVEARNITKSYRNTGSPVPVLRGVNLSVKRGEFVAVVGQSGSGKSTLLHVLGTLDKPDEGEVHLAGGRIDRLSSKRRDKIRNARIGMVFQFYHLLPEMTALENVLSPLMVRHGVLGYLRRRGEFRKRAHELLEMVGLGHRVKHKPRQMSGGEAQRTAIARALIASPEVLLADEPTGNLDRASGDGVMQILRSLNRQRGLTIIMVTHDLAIAEQADRIVRLVEGRVERA